MDKLSMKLNYIVKEFCANFITSRLFIFILLQFFILHIFLNPLKRFIMVADYPITPWIIPFMMTNIYYPFLFMLVVIYYFSNIPFMDYSQMYHTIRLGRIRWGISKICRIVINSFILMIIEIVLCILPLIPKIELTNDWGKVINTLAMTDAAQQYGIDIAFPYEIINKYNPIEAIVIIFLIGGLVITFIGITMFTLSIYYSRTLSICIATIIAVMPIVVQNMYRQFEWITFISPVAWLNLLMIGSGKRFSLPTLNYIFGSLIIISMVLCALSLFKIKRMDFSWAREE